MYQSGRAPSLDPIICMSPIPFSTVGVTFLAAADLRVELSRFGGDHMKMSMGEIQVSFEALDLKC